MTIYMFIQNIITKSALMLGFVRQSVHDMQLSENSRITAEHSLEQQERLRITDFLNAEQQERVRMTDFFNAERQERVRMTDFFYLEQSERLRMTQFLDSEKQQHRVATELFQSEQRIHHETRLYREYEQTERLRVVKDYLDLMEDCLTGSIYEDPPMQIWDDTKGFNPQTREYGWDWPSKAHTMIGRKRLHNLRLLTETVLMNGVVGDVVETGVWRGGACILARAVLHAYGDPTRKVWLADSFEGLPSPKVGLYPADKDDKFYEFKELAVNVEAVKSNFLKYGLLDDKVEFIVGWFDQTLPNCVVEDISILRLDGDMYESTIVALDNLYSKVTVGGFVIVDDYHVVNGCKQAVHDFFERQDISPTLLEIDGVGVYWQKV